MFPVYAFGVVLVAAFSFFMGRLYQWTTATLIPTVSSPPACEKCGKTFTPGSLVEHAKGESPERIAAGFFCLDCLRLPLGTEPSWYVRRPR